ncbi:MAG: CoA transferase [Chloroflexi bacterium]|nr:CoA transferase [Chloroflexota bacterium]
MPYQPLTGIRVLDLSRLLPGPYLTQLLADLGAEVIKIETPLVGDYARMAPAEMGLGSLFEMVNHGKKSVGLNYRNPRGRELFLELARTADVILEGFRPGAVDRWGIGYEAVRDLKADTVYCSLSGYGQNGPYRQRAGHDLGYAAVGGALGLNAPPGGGAPVPYGVPVADLSGGMLAAIAILGALVGRERTGEGAYLDLSLFDGVLSWVAPLAGGAYFSGLTPEGGKLPLSGGMACFNVYETADGKYLSLAALEPHFWGNFCKAVDREDLIPRQFDPDLGAELTAVFRQKTRAEWEASFAEQDTCIEPVNSFEEMLRHPQARARGHVREVDGKPVGLNSPFVFARAERTPPPALGEHTREVLGELGVSEEEMDALDARGVIKG